jgi:hypothetical protein
MEDAHRFPGLPVTVSSRIRAEIPRDQWTSIASLLAEECAANLPFLENRPTEQERVQIAALDFGKGRLSSVREYLQAAKTDWRDVLMWAGA